MSVLIKGINVKEIKRGAVAIVNIDDVVYFVHGNNIVPVPDHGDLIDRETLMSEIADWQLSEAPKEGINWDSGRNVTSHELQYGIYRLLGDVYEEVRDIPAVIPAEWSEDERKEENKRASNTKKNDVH